MNEYKDWIVRFYASHKDIPKGHSDCETLKELIRCKDCKHYDDKHEVCCVYLVLRLPKNEDDFCSDGERKEE